MMIAVSEDFRNSVRPINPNTQRLPRADEFRRRGAGFGRRLKHGAEDIAHVVRDTHPVA
jgi:hypothetical protein